MVSSQIPFSLVAAVVVLGLLVRFCIVFVRHRQHFRSLPSPPSSFLWGHIKVMSQVKRELPPDISLTRVLSTIKEKYGLGGIFCVDLWPLGPAVIVLGDANLMTSFAKKDHRKSDFIIKGLLSLFGHRSVALLQGRDWRVLRSLFAPAFTPAYLTNAAPDLVGAVDLFASRVDGFAASGENCVMFRLAADLTFDIISKIAFGRDFDHQRKPSDAEYYHTSLVAHQITSWLNPLRNLYNMAYSIYLRRKLDGILAERIKQRYEEGRNDRSEHKAIVDWLLFPEMDGKSNILTDLHQGEGDLTPDLLQTIVDNVKTLFFAGHDGTAAFFCYALAGLMENPTWLARLREEHDEVFGQDAQSLATSVMNNPKLLNQLPLTTACIKETLRLHSYSPLGRQADEGEYLEYGETKVPIWGAHIQFSNFDVHRNNEYWPDADRYDPTRFLEGNAAKIQVETFRPFERGLRNCIGQELAMIELRLLLLFTLRSFDFEFAYDADSPKAIDRYGGHAYPRMKFIIFPSEGLPLKVRRRDVKA